ncbi:MAG: putative Ig domain-containing protein [Caldilineaceae bacterium]|nr:putative Ig domain-containing protein [Caldilineaceae bacterium]
MRQRQGTLLCIAIGLAFVLAASLISLLAPSQGTAYAQTTPSASISIGEDTLPQGGATYLAVGLRNMPQDPDDDGEFHPDLVFRLDLHRNSDGSWVEENDCDSTLFGKNYHIDTWWRDDITFFRGTDNLNIARDCPTGSYRVTVAAKNNSTNTTIATDTRSLTVLEGPDVDIGFSAQPFYRGNEIDVTMEFSHLNNLQDRSGLSYRADIMKIISENSMNYADDCEGEALGNVDKSQDANHASSNLADTPSGSVDGNDPDGTVEKYGEVATTCPTGNYKLSVKLWDSEQNELMSATKLFAVTTNPNATPFATMELSATTVTPGTEITYEASFFDLATYEGQSVDFREELTKDGANAPDSCKVGLFDIDVGTRLYGNPYVHSGTIPTTCPAGSYTLKAMLKNTDGNEILSASASFRIGTPVDLKPSAPAVSAITTRQNDYFSQQLAEGTGGDGTLTYTATGYPAGLEFVTTTRTLRGTPTGHGVFTVIYTVTDSDGDSAHVNISFTVVQDHLPSFDPNQFQDFVGRAESPFEKQLPPATGGDGTLEYDATGLPPGLSFITLTRTITGTPPTAAIRHVNYTATDRDGDVARQSLVITITADSKPYLNPSDYLDLTGRVGSEFIQILEQSTTGDPPLKYEASPLPPGLELKTPESLVKIKGTPTMTGTTNVTFSVRDEDGDASSVSFQILIEADNQPTLAPVNDIAGRVGSPFTKTLPVGSGGDGELDHDIRKALPDGKTTLPDGLVYDESDFEITGIPTKADSWDVEYVVTDGDGDQVVRPFTIIIEEDSQPALDPVPNFNAKVGTRFTKVLDPASGGDSDLAYAAEPLPAGLAFIESSRTITGTPTAEVETTTTVVYTATDVDDTATDVDDDVARQSFKIIVYLKPTLRAVQDAMATKDAVFPLELQGAVGGRGPFKYTASPLPDGLRFVESSLIITGTPTTVEDVEVTYTVTDADDDSHSIQFEISVKEGDTEPTLRTIDDDYARVNSPYSLELPLPAGGNAPFVYTAAPRPTGLNFITSTRSIEGTPTTVESVTVTYTVTDADSDVVTQTFTIHVQSDLMPSFNAIDPIDARVGSPFDEVLPEATSGDPPITYTATNLPDGLTFAPGSRTISGTPTSTATKTVTYGAEDEDGDKDSVEFEIVVSPDSQPSLPAVDDFRARRGDPLEKQLPPAAGGDGTLVYSAQGLPPGLDFIATTQIITGTPTRDGNFTVTYAVVDEDNDRSSVQFEIEVAENWHSNKNIKKGGTDTGQTTPSKRNTKELVNQPALGKIPDYDAKVDTMFTQVLIAATGGDGEIGYTAAPLPPGLNFIESSRTITGKPTTEGTTSVVYTATDEDGDKVHKTFDIVVYLKPSLTDVSDVMATKDAVFTLDLPDVEGGRRPFNFTASPRPAGLDFIESSRTITGTPTTVEEVDVTYTVTDADGDSATVEFKISVSEGDTSPTLQTINAQYARKDSPFSFTLPRPAGGNAPYTYTATPLPTGLSFNESELMIEGTPTQVEDVSMTYTVTDTDLDVASRSFTIHVSEDLMPSFNDIDDFEARVNSPFSEVLPEAISGDLPITYTATNLPDGLTFAPGSRTISGTPTSPVTKTVTYGAEDEDGDKASTTFKIEVAENRQSNPPKNNNNNNNGGKSTSGSSTKGGSNNGGTNNGGSNNGGTNNGGSNNGDTSIGGASIDGTSNGGTNTRYDSGGNPGGGTGNNYLSTNPCLTPINGAPSTVPVATTTPYLLNVRQGPGLHYAVVTTVPRGTQANIFGRDASDDWFLVEIQGIAGRVWIYQDLTTVQGSLNSVPFVSPTDTNPIGSPVDAPLAITKPNVLNVRSGPGLNYQVLTTVPSGTQGRIIGVSPDYQWYRVVLGVLSQPAWVYASLTTVTGSLATVKVYTLAEIDGGLSVICDRPFALTTPYVLNVRGGPGIEYDILTTVPRGTRAEIVGIGPQNQWLYVELDALTEPAWIFKDLTTVFGSLAGVRQIASWQVGQPGLPGQPDRPEQPGTANEGDRPLAITYSSIVNVREGPGENYNVLIAVGQGTRARILGLDPTEAWYLVEIDGIDQLGWIFEDLTVLVGSLNNVKRISAEEISMLPVAIPKIAVLNVRSGPSTSYGIVTTTSPDIWYQILGISASSNWFRIKMDGIAGQTWVFRDLTRLVGPLASAIRTVEGESSPPATAASPPKNGQQATPQQPSSQQQASPPPAPPAPAVSSITIELSLPDDGRIDLDVTWTDSTACAQVYNLYYRASADSSVYFSLETAVTSSTASSKSLSFETLPVSSFISAWCGTSSGGRQVAEVQIDPTQAGTYSSQPVQPQSDALVLEQ